MNDYQELAEGIVNDDLPETCRNCGAELAELDYLTETDGFTTPEKGIHTYDKYIGYECPECGMREEI